MNRKILIRKIKSVIKNPKRLLIHILYIISPLLDDELYLKILFPLYTGYKLDLKNPVTYNQKLQWLKLNYRKPYMTKLVDKYEAKFFVEKLIGSKYLINTLGVWNSFDEIDFDLLPEKFVLKTTHDQGGIVICKNKNEFDKKSAKRKLESRLKKSHYFLSREWPYKNVKPRILAEEYMVDESKVELIDYKFFCFNGEVKTMFIATERQSGKEVKFDFYDRNFNHLEIVQIHPQSFKQINKPKNFEKMIELAEFISKGYPHLRVDFYNIDGNIYFGEFTFFHHGGLIPFHPKEWDYKFGNWVNLNDLA